MLISWCLLSSPPFQLEKIINEDFSILALMVMLQQRSQPDKVYIYIEYGKGSVLSLVQLFDPGTITPVLGWISCRDLKVWSFFAVRKWWHAHKWEVAWRDAILPLVKFLGKFGKVGQVTNKSSHKVKITGCWCWKFFFSFKSCFKII